jgi:Fic family protein
MYLAQFHYDFAVIHPFLDGNGRVARLILDQQASFIFRQPLHLQIDREQYYKALRFGNMGSLDELRDLILRAIGKCMDTDKRFAG